MHQPRRARSANSQVRGALLQHHRHLGFYVLDENSYQNAVYVAAGRVHAYACYHDYGLHAPTGLRPSVSLDGKLSADMAAYDYKIATLRPHTNDLRTVAGLNNVMPLSAAGVACMCVVI